MLSLITVIGVLAVARDVFLNRVRSVANPFWWKILKVLQAACQVVPRCVPGRQMNFKLLIYKGVKSWSVCFHDVPGSYQVDIGSYQVDIGRQDVAIGRQGIAGMRQGFTAVKQSSITVAFTWHHPRSKKYANV